MLAQANKIAMDNGCETETPYTPHPLRRSQRCALAAMQRRRRRLDVLHLHR